MQIIGKFAIFMLLMRPYGCMLRSLRRKLPPGEFAMTVRTTGLAFAVLFVAGGSQGARSINLAVSGAAKELARNGVQVLHVVNEVQGVEDQPRRARGLHETVAVRPAHSDAGPATVACPIPLDKQALDAALGAIKERCGARQIWLEPGAGAGHDHGVGEPCEHCPASLPGRPGDGPR